MILIFDLWSSIFRDHFSLLYLTQTIKLWIIWWLKHYIITYYMRSLYERWNQRLRRACFVSFSTGNESDRSTRRPVEDRLKILTRPTRYNKRLPEITEIVLKSLSVRCNAILGEVKSIAPHHCCVIWVHQSRLRIAMLNQNPLKIGWDFYQTTWRHTPKQFTQSKCVAA